MSELRSPRKPTSLLANHSHPREILGRWVTHYNRGRPHSSLGPELPDPPPNRVVASNGHQLPDGHCVVAMPILGGLHRTSSRAEGRVNIATTPSANFADDRNRIG